MLILPCYAAGERDFNLPQLGRAGGAVISQGELDTIGKHVLEQLRRGNTIMDDPLVTHYIRDIGQRIASHSSGPAVDIHYFVIKNQAMNSFALPGRNVGIFTGLWLKTDNENELAGVIAHETAHVTQRHIARAVADSQGMGWKSLAGMLAGLILAAGTGNPQAGIAAMMGTQAALLQHRINFTRHEEAEADRVGIAFMARAGYDPEGMVQMFKKFEVMSRGEVKPPEFLLTHPLDRARIVDAAQRVRQLPTVEHRNSRAYLLMQARVRVLTADNMADVLNWFNAKKAKTKEADSTARNALDYGRALALARLDRPKKALAIVKPLLQKHPAAVAYHLLVGNAQFEAGRVDAALATLSQAQRLFPDNLAVRMARAHKLMAADRPDDAKSILEMTNLKHADRPAVIHLLAKASNAAGDVGAGRYYMSRYYQLNGLLDPAIQQIRLALNSSAVSEYQRARYQARLDDLTDARKKAFNNRRRQFRNRIHLGVQRLPGRPHSHHRLIHPRRHLQVH